MEQKLNILYKECIEELQSIGINILDEEKFYRQRIASNFTRKYRCGKCKGKFIITQIGITRQEE